MAVIYEKKKPVAFKDVNFLDNSSTLRSNGPRRMRFTLQLPGADRALSCGRRVPSEWRRFGRAVPRDNRGLEKALSLKLKLAFCRWRGRNPASELGDWLARLSDQR